MHQIRLFMGLESQLKELEDEVNAWLAASPDLKVISLHSHLAPQSAVAHPMQAQAISRTANAPSDVLICVHYEK